MRVKTRLCLLASGGDEEKVCFYLKVLHSCQACEQRTSSACARASPLARRPLYHPEQKSFGGAQLSEPRPGRRGWEAMINGGGTLAEISGSLCKAVLFCLMWNKRTTVTKVPASLHSGTAALRTHCISSPLKNCARVLTCMLVHACVFMYIL